MLIEIRLTVKVTCAILGDGDSFVFGSGGKLIFSKAHWNSARVPPAAKELHPTVTIVNDAYVVEERVNETAMPTMPTADVRNTRHLLN